VSDGIRTHDIQDHNRGYTLTGGLMGDVWAGHGASCSYDHRVSARLPACSRSHSAPRIGRLDQRASAVVDELEPLVMRSWRLVAKPALNCDFSSQWFSSCNDSVASSSRSQVAARTASAAAHLAWDRPSVDVRWRPLLAVAIVTHFVTQSFSRRGRPLGRARSARWHDRPFSGVADAQLRLDVLGIRSCLRLRQGAGDCRRCRRRYQRTSRFAGGVSSRDHSP